MRLTLYIPRIILALLTSDQCHQLIISAYSNNGGLQMAKAVLDLQTPFPDTGPQAIPWCICGKCRDMHNTIENVCCRSRPSITTSASFDTILLDMHVLAVCIVSRSGGFCWRSEIHSRKLSEGSVQTICYVATWVPGEIQQEGTAILCSMECKRPLSCSW